MESDKIYNIDCLEGMKHIPDGSIDAIICDLPYGTMKGIVNAPGWENCSCEWDEIIPTDQLFEQYERVLRKGGTIVLFSQEPYTSHLRTFKAKNIDFCYPMIWKKNSAGNALMSKSAPVSVFEDINVFAKANPLHDFDLAHPLREYFAKVLEFIAVPKAQIMDELGSRIDHTFRCNSSQFALCTAETYDALISRYRIDKMQGFRTFEDLKAVDDKFIIVKEHERTFNLPEGKAQLLNVLEFDKDPKEGLHPTQKPLALIQRLVLTYSNEGDTILDNCMGSGTTAVACIKEKRHFIGFELNKEYFDKACKRIDAERRQLTLF